jgi:hypothetical protein
LQCLIAPEGYVDNPRADSLWTWIGSGGPSLKDTGVGLAVGLGLGKALRDPKNYSFFGDSSASLRFPAKSNGHTAQSCALPSDSLCSLSSFHGKRVLVQPLDARSGRSGNPRQSEITTLPSSRPLP